MIEKILGGTHIELSACRRVIQHSGYTMVYCIYPTFGQTHMFDGFTCVSWSKPSSKKLTFRAADSEVSNIPHHVVDWTPHLYITDPGHPYQNGTKYEALHVEATKVYPSQSVSAICLNPKQVIHNIVIRQVATIFAKDLPRNSVFWGTKSWHSQTLSAAFMRWRTR